MAGSSEAEATVERIPVTIEDKSGKQHNAVLKATILGPEDLPGVVKRDPVSPDSAAEEDDPYQRLAGSVAQVIEPPYDLEFMSLAADNSSELGQNIRAMVTNTCGFGYTLRELPEVAELGRDKHEEKILAERSMVRANLRAVHPKYSLRKIRSDMKHDKWLVGNGYIELIENARNELSGLNHVHGHTVRLTTLCEEPVVVKVPVVRPDQDFQIEYREMETRFRRYVQMRSDRLVWFKEAGDPRHLHRRTGEFSEEPLPLNERATSLLHHKIYSPHSAYGVPVWMGSLFSLFGARAAEELNWATMRSNAVPSMFLIVENGMLTKASIKRVKEFIQGQVQASMNYSRVIILEGEANEEGSITPGAFKIKVEPVKRMQQTDELWQEYDKNSRDKIRQSFRLPPIFVGRSDDYTRATADTSRDIADEQVFSPDRLDDDELFTRFVMLPWGAKYHVFKSMHPNVTDDIELIRMMGISERSGAMTPRRADRIARDVFGDDLGPLPQGIDLDVPFTIQFAQAQQGGGGTTGTEHGSVGGDPTTRAIDNLLNFRKRIEEELLYRSGLREDE